MLVDQPVFDADSGAFGGETGLGNIAIDLAYAPKLSNSSLMFAYGLITSMPTATNDLGSGQWTLGPELLIGKLNPKWVAGLFPNYQWFSFTLSLKLFFVKAIHLKDHNNRPSIFVQYHAVPLT